MNYIMLWLYTLIHFFILIVFAYSVFIFDPRAHFCLGQNWLFYVAVYISKKYKRLHVSMKIKISPYKRVFRKNLN